MRRPPSNRLLLLSPLLTALPASAFTPPSISKLPSSSTSSRADTSSSSSSSSSCRRHHAAVSSTSLRSNPSRLSPTPSTQPQPLSTCGDWSAYLDESKGLIYYFHRRTGESTWDPPAGVDLNVELTGEKKSEMRDRLRAYLEERLGQEFRLGEGDELLRERDRQLEQQRTNDVRNNAEESSANALDIPKTNQDIASDKARSGIVASYGPWVAIIDEKRGMIYYHNDNTDTTTWSRPANFPFIKLSARKRKELQEQNRRYLEWRKEGTVKKVNVLGKGVVTTSSKNVQIGNELDSLDKIQKDIDARLSQVDGKQKQVTPIVKQDRWAAYLDDKSGLVYYYDEIEKKSVWDPPNDEFLDMVKQKMVGGSDGRFTDPRDKKDVNGQDVPEGEAKDVEDAASGVAQLDRSPVDYDAAARLAYKSHGDAMEDFEAFKSKYIEEMSSMVARKHKERMGEAAKIANEVKLAEAKAIEESKRLARCPVDYDAAARFAYDMAGTKGDFEAFKSNYLLESTNMVARKHKDRLQEMARIADELRVEQEKQIQEEKRLARSLVDYDAAVKFAYEAAGATGEFDAFKTKYLVDTSAMIAAKHKARMEDSKLSAAEGEEESQPPAEVVSNPFFFLGVKDVTEDGSATAKVEKEQEVISPVQSASAEVIDKHSLNVETDESTTSPAISEILEAQPELPKDDPFASGSDVASLISPIQTQTLYDILQCSPTASRSEIKRSYLSLAKETHPDALLQNGITYNLEAEQRFNEIARAYKILSDPTERRRYDRELKAKGLSRSAGTMFESWVMGAAKAMDEALAKAESDLKKSNEKKSS
ncbi:hypothetical protein HJC23_009192 [Cyclotella cryptica]|uniref:Uncharacterized protein n=1 Tax=Cyclotella cryptica TaxID=29204 RepID=A0ABD3PM43_9STRA|eukprot:CCRYP_013791-RA/>CCRYP_013791-RA protein AED:0.00 eAED:0.00 QI:716/-1/1/1/-1/1/1/371/818